MSEIDTLEKIKEKEGEAEMKIANANSGYESSIKKTKAKAEESLYDFKHKADLEYQKIVQDAKDKAQTKGEQILKQKEKDLSKLKHISEAKAIDIFENVVEEYFGV